MFQLATIFSTFVLDTFYSSARNAFDVDVVCEMHTL